MPSCICSKGGNTLSLVTGKTPVALYSKKIPKTFLSSKMSLEIRDFLVDLMLNRAYKMPGTLHAFVSSHSTFASIYCCTHSAKKEAGVQTA